MKKSVIVLVLFSFSLILNAQNNNQKEKFQPTFEKSKNAVEDGNYQFIAELVFDDETREKVSSTFNKLTIDETIIIGELGLLKGSDDQSLPINGTIQNKILNIDDEQQRVLIAFDVSSGMDVYNCSFRIMPNGRCFLKVRMPNGYNISYVGKIK